MAEEKYNVELNLPDVGKKKEPQASGEIKYLTPHQAGFIPRSVRMEVNENNELPNAPCKELVDAVVLLADISGFTALGEKLADELGPSEGTEEFASQVSSAISVLGTSCTNMRAKLLKLLEIVSFVHLLKLKMKLMMTMA